MPTTLPSSVPARSRWHSVLAALALVGAMVATSAPIAAVADPVGTVSGTVTAPDGSPVAGVTITLSIPAGEGTSFSVTTWTDGSGAYGFSALEPAVYSLQAYASGYQQYFGSPLTISAEQPDVIVDIALQGYASGAGVIAGTVTGDGVPLAGIGISASQSATGQLLSTVSDENGEYEFATLATGEWSISAWAGSEFQYLFVPTVNLTESAPSVVLDLAFISWPTGTSSISGIVTEAGTGTPVEGASISVLGVDVAHNSFVNTDSAGAFSIDELPAGTFSLNLYAAGYLPVGTEVTVLEGEAATVELALVAANATITGHVKDKSGTPIAGIFVDAHTADGAYSGAYTDENGDYTITEVGAVEYTLVIGGMGTAYKQKSKTVTPAANGSATVNFTLKPRTTGSLSGLVYGPNGEPYNVPVCVSLHSSKNKKSIAEVTTIGSDFGDGTFTFDKLKPGDYTVSFEDCDADPAVAFDPFFFGGVTKYADATFITVTAAEDSYGNDVTIALREATSTISGHVQKGNGTPLAGLTVTATDGVASTATAVTDANGDYTLTGLFTGRYTVTVGGEGTLYTEKQKHLTTVDNGDVTADFTLKKSS